MTTTLKPPLINAANPSPPKCYGEAAMGTLDEYGPDLTTWPGFIPAPAATLPAAPPPTPFRQRHRRTRISRRILTGLLNRPIRPRTAIYKPFHF
jgi:hypothetical protein